MSQKVKKSKVKTQQVDSQADAEEWVTLTLPLGVLIPEQYVPQHLDVQLSRRQGEALKRLTNAVAGRGIRLENGRFIANAADAVRYLLEKLSEAAKG